MFSHFTESSWWRSSYSHYPSFSDTLSVSGEGPNASFSRGSGMDLTSSSAGARNFKELLPSYGPGQYSCDKCGKVGFDTVLIFHPCTFKAIANRNSFVSGVPVEVQFDNSSTAGMWPRASFCMSCLSTSFKI